MTILTERIAAELAAEGADHPVAAAVTIALRGIARQTRDEFAESLGIAPADLRALEAGTVELASLPTTLLALAFERDLDLVQLGDTEPRL